MHQRLDQAELADFAAAIGDAEQILAQQRALLETLGVDVPQSTPPAPTAGSVAHLNVLRLAIAEISARQDAIDDTILSRRSMPDVAMDAFIHATHRLTTSIDVALGCSEEIAEIAGDKEVARIADDAASALHLIYHYANELNDLVSFTAPITEGALEELDCFEAFQIVLRDLHHLVRRSGIKVALVAPDATIKVATLPRVLHKTLSYLVLCLISSPGVSTITCVVRRVDDHIEFLLTSNGRGVSLEDRALSGTVSALFGQSAPDSDSSGFAVARRLARLFRGALSLEVLPGVGQTLYLTLPDTIHDQSRAAELDNSAASPTILRAASRGMR